MRHLPIILAAGLIVLGASCNDGLMDRSSLDMDAIDWAAVDENVFLVDKNEMKVSNDDLVFYMLIYPPISEALKDRYIFFLATSSDQYYLRIELNGDHPFPFNEKGVLSINHLVTAGDCYIFPKDKTLFGPFGDPIGGSYTDRFPVKLLIDCDVRLEGDELTFGPGEYNGISKGNSLKGSVQVKMLTEDRDKYSFSFNSLTPYLHTSGWVELQCE